MLSVNEKWLRYSRRALPPVPHSTLREEVFGELNTDDVKDLLDLLESSTPDDRWGAVGLLMILDERSDFRLAGEYRLRYRHRVVEIARAEFPQSLPGIIAFQAWRVFDREAAETFITEALPLERIGDGEPALYVISQLRAFGGARPLKRLEEMTGLTGRAAIEHEAALRAFRPLSEHEMQSLAKKWRKSKSPQLLSQIYHRYINRLPVGTAPIAELLKLLGEPSARSGRGVWYQPNEGVQLYLEADAHGRLTARKLSGE